MTSSVPAPAAADPAVTEVLAAFGELLVAQRRLRGRDARQPGGLSFAQFRLLAELEDEAGVPTSRLAESAGVSPATATGMLDSLEAMGVVTRERSTEDRRVVLTRLTPEGRRVRDARRAEARRVFAEALATLEPEALAVAPRVLRLLATAMEAV